MTTVEDVLRFPFTRADPLRPPEEYGRLRETAPVCRVTLWDGSWAWLLTRYEDVRAVLYDKTSSADTLNPNLPHPSPAAKAAKQGQRFFSRMDPPEHDIHRRMLAAAFAIKAIERMRPRVTELIGRLLDDMRDRGGPVDIVTALGEPIPGAMICDLLGLPESDAAFFLDRLSASLDYSATPEQIQVAAGELQDYFLELVESRAREPRDDLTSRLVTVQMAEGLLGREELARMLWLLLIGGFDTTINVISLGTQLLIEYPDQADDLRTHPEIADNAAEELLRYITVTHNVAVRAATRDLELSGQPIRVGDGLIAPLAAANWDPSVFPEPRRLDLRRANAHAQLGFGFGIHQCLGQALARLELRVLFPELVRRFPGLRLADDRAELRYKPEAMIYGVASLPVTW
ncbi:MAG TPA: cytochrome P450 [Pseudonocardia sp.]